MRLLPLLVLAACGSDDPVTEQDRLATARAAWGTDLTDYTFDEKRTCFGCAEPEREIRIVVAGDAVASATYVADGTPVSATTLASLLTVTGLFDFIELTLAQDFDEVEIEYGDNGFPTFLFVDGAASVDDDETTHEWSNLVP